ncbi:hypothetical protein MLD38_023152 [Melastoma candidum]|uniref:Uncharacterized protein n=1 Tax=Melastoma candidum TaxID=119954 RepID=A0ACB9QKR9_9MYRT|nr:hypothetical protein MLD38_023152 [Melastoma candidum]
MRNRKRLAETGEVTGLLLGLDAAKQNHLCRDSIVDVTSGYVGSWYKGMFKFYISPGQEDQENMHGRTISIRRKRRGRGTAPRSTWELNPFLRFGGSPDQWPPNQPATGMPEQRKEPFPGHGTTMYGYLRRGSKVEVTSKETGFLGSWFLATVVTPPELPGSSMKRRRMTFIQFETLVNEDETMLLRERVDSELLRPVPPEVSRGGGFEVGECVDAFEKDGWWTGVVDGLVPATEDGEGGERYLVSFQEAEAKIEFRREELRLHLDWKDGKWFLFRNNEYQELLVKSDGFVDVFNNSRSSDPIEVMELNKSVSSEFNADLCAETMPLNEQSGPPTRQLSPCSSNSGYQEMTGLDCPNSRSTHSYPTKKLKRKCVDSSLVHDKGILEDSNNEESDETAFCLTPALKLSDNGVLPLRDCQFKNGVELIKSASNEKGNVSYHAETSIRREEWVNKIHDFVAAGEVQEANDVHRKSSEEQPLEAIGTESTDEGQGDVQKLNSIDGIPSARNQSLAVVGAELPNMDPGHSHLVEKDGEGPLVGLSELQQIVGNDVVEMSQSLPFVKSSPVWKSVESLEILRKFPQKPHFLPLIEDREQTREGCAIGKMVTFASTIEDAIKLSVNDPVSAFTDCLETLRPLELYGFDVKMVESRLMKLLSLKEQQRKLDKTKNEVERQISELSHKRVKLAAEIDEADHKIKVYKQQLALASMEEEEVHREILILNTS